MINCGDREIGKKSGEIHDIQVDFLDSSFEYGTNRIYRFCPFSTPYFLPFAV